MLTLLRLAALTTLFSCWIGWPGAVAAAKTGDIAEQQLRHIATHYPGRMAGSPAEMLTADYLQQWFQQMGYPSDSRRFRTRYNYLQQNGEKTLRNVSATSVIAAKEGEVPQQILIVAHLDSHTPLSDAESQQSLGGLSAQAADNNASGLGVMLELAERLRNTPLHYSLRFVALSGEEIGHRGSEDYLARMKPDEKRQTLLVIDLNTLLVGQHLTFRSGKNTPQAVIRQTRDRAQALAKRHGISALATAGDDDSQNPFDRDGLPLLTVTASDGPASGLPAVLKQRFPSGLRNQAQRDNLAFIDRWLPGRITSRTHNSVAVLLPLLRELANP